MEGWIKLYREIQGHWIWRNESYLKAWITILLTVNHDPKRVLISGELIDCGRGQSLLSLSNWANTFGNNWSIQKVRTFFELLERDSMINTEGLHKTTRLTVCNYESYQDQQQANNTPNPSNQHADNTEITTNKNDKNDKNNIKKESNDFLTQIIGVFQTSYLEVFGHEYQVMNKGKERASASKILALYKQKYPDHNSQQTLIGLSTFFSSCCMVPDEWLQKNMSLSIIVSKFNEISNHILNVKRKNNRGVASRSEEIGSIVSAVFEAKGVA